MTVLFGIKNCDTVKKARRWLDSAQIPYAFHDFRADGITQEQVSVWLDAVGQDKLLNKRSTTWKQLSESDKALAQTPSSLIALLVTNPTLIKRPVLTHEEQIQVGFKDEHYSHYFSL